MPIFTLEYAMPYERTGASIAITDQYFTVDTADRATLESWKQKNPWNLIYAWDGENLAGFSEILPVTDACGQALLAQELREEDMTAAMILPPEKMHLAKYLYYSGIAVADRDTYHAKCCAAALIAATAFVIRDVYDPRHLVHIFANPTTFWGNRIIGKFGFQPLSAKKRAIKAGNAIYAVTTDHLFFDRLQAFEKRYGRFIDGPITEASVKPPR